MAGIDTALGVYTLITGTITVVDALIQIYDAVQDKSGITKELRKVSAQIPSIKGLLEDAAAQYRESKLDAQVWISAGQDVQHCDEACRELCDLLESAYPEADATKRSRAFKNVRNMASSKGKTAEQLLKDIHGYMELLKHRRIVTNTKLLEAIKETVDELFQNPGITQNNVNGPNIGRDQIFHGSSGPMFNGPGVTYNAGGLPDELNEELIIQRLKDWLGFAEIDTRECEIKEAHKKTFRWALQPHEHTDDMTRPDPGLVKWLRESDGLFWIQGKLGSGKSTLMKYMWHDPLLEDHLRAWAGGMPLYRASFFFAKKGASELQRSLQGLYRTLLLHFIKSDKSLARIAFPHWQSSYVGHEPESPVLRSALLRILKHRSSSARHFLFIDGLDEYEESNPKLQTELARDILNLADLSGMKIVVASRPEAPLMGRFAECPTLRLQNLTRGDIKSYVTAEVRERTLPRTLDEDDAHKLNRLADEVVRRAEGVFLWVSLVITDLVTGLDEAETIQDLHVRLSWLDNDLYILFRQILLERIPPAHRQQIARHLLISSYTKKIHTANYLVAHAVGYQVQVGSNSMQPDIHNMRNNRQTAMDLLTQLPVRSRGLCLAYTGARMSDARVGLIHSSMSEFLARSDIRTILQEQAGDFEPGLAVRIGFMALLVMLVHESHENNDDIGDDAHVLLFSIMFSLDTDIHISSVIPLRSMACLESLFAKSWEGYHFPGIGILSWIPKSLNSFRSTSLLASKTLVSIAEYVTLNRNFYCLQSQIELNQGIPHTNGPPLLFYAVFPTDIVFERYLEFTELLISEPLKLLLQHGADPNETYEGRTPWGELLLLFEAFRESRSSIPVMDRSTELRHGLDAARLMLDHGADPNFDEAAYGAGPNSGGGGTGPVVVSTRIFGKLLTMSCCGSTALADCSCLRLGRVRIELTELVELVEQKKLEKRLDPPKHRVKLSKRVAKAWSSAKRIWGPRQQALDKDMPEDVRDMSMGQLQRRYETLKGGLEDGNDDLGRLQLTAVPRYDL